MKHSCLVVLGSITLCGTYTLEKTEQLTCLLVINHHTAVPLHCLVLILLKLPIGEKVLHFISVLFIQCGTSHNICPVCCNFHTLLSVRAEFSVWIWQKYILPLVVLYFPSEGVLKIRSKEDFALSRRILNVIFLYCRFFFGGGGNW